MAFQQTSLEACFFCDAILILIDRLNNVRSKWKNAINSFEMTLNPKHTTEKNEN